MPLLQETLPALRDDVTPPAIRGVADLTSFAYQGNGFERLVARIGTDTDQAARLFDFGIACQLDFHRDEGLQLQQAALALTPLYRVARDPGATQNTAPPTRLLAIVGPGDLMVNTPLDFLTNHLNVRLDLLHILPDHPLPAAIPDHDVAFFAYSDPDPPMLRRLSALYHRWPRPCLNDPAFLPITARDALSRTLAGIAEIRAPEVVQLSRAGLQNHLRYGTPIAGFVAPERMFPCLIRPTGTHAGHGLEKAGSPDDLRSYLDRSDAKDFYLTAFEDYASNDRLYHKYRIAFVDRQPFLCHMAVSEHWMVHYLNAGMEQSAVKRAQEAQAMQAFDTGFARRHASGFAQLHDRLGFDLYSIDCAETRDGRLLVFEADAAAIIHLMDPADMFPYKQQPMRRVFTAFEAMLKRQFAN